MKNFKKLFYIPLALLISIHASKLYACNSPSQFNETISSTLSPILDVDIFTETIISEMRSLTTKGYALSILDQNGTPLTEIMDGYARTNCDEDGEQLFNLDTETTWGSVSKIVSTVALLKAIENNPLYSLDTLMSDVLPRNWSDNLHTRFQSVTLRMLLQHKAGLRNSYCSTLGKILREGDATNYCGGNNPRPDVGTRQYSNTGIELLSVIIPYITDFWPTIQNDIANNWAHGNTEAYDNEMVADLSSLYINFVNNSVLSPANVTGNCDIANNRPGNYALFFSSRTDSTGAFPGDNSAPCAAGGWTMSTEEMNRFLYTIKNTSSIISTNSYNLMESSFSDSLGWWRRDANGEVYYGHNGGLSGPNGGSSSAAFSLPGGLTGAIVTHTGPITKSPQQVFEDAFDAAHSKHTRIKLFDSTESLDDNESIVKKRSTSLSVELEPRQNWSAMWAFEPAGNFFRIRNRWVNQYLYTKGTGSVATAKSDEINDSGAPFSEWWSSQWTIEESNGQIRIRNRWTNQYLFHNNNTISIAATPSIASSTWLRDPIDNDYDRVILIDNTPNNADDNIAIAAEGFDTLDVDRIPDAWWSGQWHIQNNGGYYQIYNRNSEEYLHSENGAGTLDLSIASTTNTGGTPISEWHSAQWSFEIDGDKFRIRNRWTQEYLYQDGNRLAVDSSPPLDQSGWTIQQVK